MVGGSWFLSRDLLVGVVLGELSLDLRAIIDAPNSPSSSFTFSDRVGVVALSPLPALPTSFPGLVSSSRNFLLGLLGVRGDVLVDPLPTESRLLVDDVDTVILGAMLADSDAPLSSELLLSAERDPDDLALDTNGLSGFVVAPGLLTRGFLGRKGCWRLGTRSDLLLVPTGLGRAMADGLTAMSARDMASITSLTRDELLLVDVLSSLSDFDRESLTSGVESRELFAAVESPRTPGLTGAEADIISGLYQ